MFAEKLSAILFVKYYLPAMLINLINKSGKLGFFRGCDLGILPSFAAAKQYNAKPKRNPI